MNTRWHFSTRDLPAYAESPLVPGIRVYTEIRLAFLVRQRIGQ